MKDVYPRLKALEKKEARQAVVAEALLVATMMVVGAYIVLVLV